MHGIGWHIKASHGSTSMSAHFSVLTSHCSHVNGSNLNIKSYFGFGNEILIYFNIKHTYSYGSRLKAWLCLGVFVLALSLIQNSSEQHLTLNNTDSNGLMISSDSSDFGDEADISTS